MCQYPYRELMVRRLGPPLLLLYIGDDRCWTNPGTAKLFDFHTYAGSNRAFRGTALHTNGMRNFLANFPCRVRLDQGDSFFGYILLIIEFKGIFVM